MNDKLYKLRQVIQQAVPVIMELKLGCEVNRHWDKKEIITGRFNDTVALTVIDKDGWGYLPFQVPLALSSDWKILGRPIRLADVIIVVREKHGLYTELTDYLLMNWKMGDDNLDHQSEETITFLHSVLLP